MRITVSQLRRIIRETVEEITHETDEVKVVDEIEELDAIASDEEFDSILVSESRRSLKEDIGLGTVVLGGILAILAWKGIGVAAKAAAMTVSDMSEKAKMELKAKNQQARMAEYRSAVEQLANDPKLATMFLSLNEMRGKASKEEVRSRSAEIVSYVNQQIKGGLKAGGQYPGTVATGVAHKLIGKDYKKQFKP